MAATHRPVRRPVPGRRESPPTSGSTPWQPLTTGVRSMSYGWRWAPVTAIRSRLSRPCCGSLNWRGRRTDPGRNSLGYALTRLIHFDEDDDSGAKYQESLAQHRILTQDPTQPLPEHSMVMNQPSLPHYPNNPAYGAPWVSPSETEHRLYEAGMRGDVEAQLRVLAGAELYIGAPKAEVDAEPDMVLWRSHRTRRGGSAGAHPRDAAAAAPRMGVPRRLPQVDRRVRVAGSAAAAGGQHRTGSATSFPPRCRTPRDVAPVLRGERPAGRRPADRAAHGRAVRAARLRSGLRRASGDRERRAVERGLQRSLAETPSSLNRCANPGASLNSPAGSGS